MVLINGIKYACDRCIRGHRVSGCRHVEAPLKRIKRKGRPTTQGRSPDAAFSDEHDTRSASPFSPPDMNDPPTLGKSVPPLPHADSSHEDGPADSKLLPVISTQELEHLRHDPTVVIELPDGTVLAEPSGRQSQQYPHHPTHQRFHHPYSHHRHRSSNFGHYFNHTNRPREQESPCNNDERAALSNNMPHRFDHLNIITHSSHIKDEDLFRPSKHLELNPDYYNAPTGPYNADLYNDTMGNNAASAAMNLHGTGDYSPNTGTVGLQPKIILNNDLYSTREELANSLPGIERMKSSAPPIKREETDIANDAYTSTHIPKLSNLY